MMQIYLDYASTTPLNNQVKKYLLDILDLYGNPSSPHSAGEKPRQILTDAKHSVAEFIHVASSDLYFTPSGSASNTLAVKGLTSENPQENRYQVFYSPTSHKSMQKACESCLSHTPLEVTPSGEIDLLRLDAILSQNASLKPLVCIEAANSEIGTVNNIAEIGSVVRKHKGTFLVDATGYIPFFKIDMGLWGKYVDILTFSGHKLHALKGVGVLWKRRDIILKPLIYGGQQDGIVSGTENVLGTASLGKAVETYDYSSVSPTQRNYVYDYIIRHIPHSYLAGAPIESGSRLPHNLYICFQGVEGESLMILLDMHGIQVSTGSACNSTDLSPSPVLTAIGMKQEDIHSCIRLTFSGQETKEELDYVCATLKQCVTCLRDMCRQDVS